MYKDRLGFQCRDSSDVLAEENAALKAENERLKTVVERMATITDGCESHTLLALLGLDARNVLAAHSQPVPDAQKEKL